MLAIAATTAPHILAADAPATTQAVIPPEAAQLVSKVKVAYGLVKSLKMDGAMSADIDIAGKTQKRNMSFSAEYQAPAMYRHMVKDEVAAGSTGQTLYVHEIQRNVYATEDAPRNRVSFKQLPGVVGELLDVQDPGLLLAVSGNSVGDMLDGATKVRKATDTVIDQKGLPTLAYTASDGRNISLAFDPQTYLLRQATYDISGLMSSRGAEQVNKALVTIDYTQIQPNPQFDGAHFAWTAPPNAREMTSDGSDENGTIALQGKPAPDFTLSGLDGKEVKLSSLKGKTVLLDFWATWCPPCVRALPEINEIYHARKDSGLQVFAIDVGEPKGKVQSFLTQKKLDLPVLLDDQEEASGKYSIRGIPTTIVIGPDGIIRKVFVGIAPGGRAEIEREIDAAGKK